MVDGKDAARIVYFCYGDELPTFVRARALWAFYISHFPDVQAYFVRSTRDLPRGEVVSNGSDLLIGLGRASNGLNEAAGYRDTGVWSGAENEDVIFRQVAVYDYFLRKYTKPFLLFNATITSVVDIRGLMTAMECMPTTRCYAGSPARLSAGGANPPPLGGLTFVSGANTLLSSDIVALLRDRYDPDSPHVHLPNDVWQALMLQDVPRTPLPLFSFIKPRQPDTFFAPIAEMTRVLLRHGHYQFRVKTTSHEAGLGLREDIDPWLMLRIMKTILETVVHVQETRALIHQILVSANPADGVALAAYDESGFFAGPRGFPMNDVEAEVVYPELRS